MLLLFSASTNHYYQHWPVEQEIPPLSNSQKAQQLPTASQCTAPAQHIYYLKIHKCASTTMEALFYRYAIRNNLTIVFFTQKHTYPDPDMLYYLPPSTNPQHYNILASHTVFEEGQIKQILPAETKYVTMVRKPLKHLESVFKYYNLCERLELEPCDEAARTFLQNPAKYDKRACVTECCLGSSDTRYYRSITKNFIASHFGLRDQITLPDTQILDWVRYIEKRFHFVGLVESLAESLVYLRRLLCFSVKDILLLPLRKSKQMELGFHHVDNDLETKYRNWSNVDYLLHRNFAAKFENLIGHMDNDFKEEVLEYNAISTTVTRFCNNFCSDIIIWYANRTLGQHLARLRAMVKSFKSARFGTFTLSGEECLFMMLNPDGFRFHAVRRGSQRSEQGVSEDYIMKYLPIDVMYGDIKERPPLLHCVEES